MMGNLDGKVAVITGAGNGIGREHALLFAREGARVVVNDPGGDRHGVGSGSAADQVVEEIHKEGGSAVAHYEPVGSTAAAQSLVAKAVDTWGKLDIAVNNAGILRDKTLLKMSEDDWDSVIHVHLRGTFTVLQAAALQMREQGHGGRIINTTSGSGLLGNFGQGNYGAAKMGIQALTRIGAMELAKFSITVNAISPIAYTRMTEDLVGNRDLDPEERMRTMGPQHISPIVAFLASDRAAHINGETFGVRGTRLYVYKVMVNRGIEKQGTDEPWTQDELAALIDRAVKV